MMALCCWALWRLNVKTYDLSNVKRSKCLDKAITPNSFSHLLVPVCHPRLVQVVFCHLGQIPGSAFSRFPGFLTQPALQMFRRLRCHFFSRPSKQVWANLSEQTLCSLCWCFKRPFVVNFDQLDPPKVLMTTCSAMFRRLKRHFFRGLIPTHRGRRPTHAWCLGTRARTCSM